MELINLKGSTYIIDGPNKIGIYQINEKEVVIIDTGLDDESGKEIMKICQENNWQIKMILNTHSHPDHIGGNYIISETLNIPVYAYKTEKVMIENPILIATAAYGGFPHKYLNNRYLTPKAVKCAELTDDILPKGIEFFPLPGHNSDMVGFKTSDDVYFLADSIAGYNIITKHKLQFMFDVKSYFTTLDFISELKGNIFVPAHGEICENIKDLAQVNRTVVLEVIDKIKELCQNGINFDNLLKKLTSFYHINLEFIQYCFIGSTLKCYLAYMLDAGLIKAEFVDNELIWKKCDSCQSSTLDILNL